MSLIFIWNYLVCFAVNKSPYATSKYWSVSTNELSIRSEIYGVIGQVTPDSKIKFVSCKLSPKSLLGISALEDICAIDMSIFCDSLWYVLFYDVWSIFVYFYSRALGFTCSIELFLSSVSGLGEIVMKWFSNPNLKHIFCFWLLHSVHLILELR